MKLRSFGKIAAVSAVALMASMHAAGVFAAPVTIQIGAPVTVPINATVANSIKVAVTPIQFGQVGSMNSTAVGDVATATITPTGTKTESGGTGYGTAGQASLIFNPGSTIVAAPSTVAVTAAFKTTALYVTYDTCVNLTSPAGSQTFKVKSIADDLTTPGGITDCTVARALGTYNFGTGTTDAAGALTFHVGATIQTDGSTNTAYENGAYTGSVNMYITY